MTRKPDGGPAFPRLDRLEVDGARWEAFKATAADGMSLRDWFAGLAMNHMLEWADVRYPASFNVIATKAYLVADAMIVARDATPALSSDQQEGGS